MSRGQTSFSVALPSKDRLRRINDPHERKQTRKEAEEVVVVTVEDKPQYQS